MYSQAFQDEFVDVLLKSPAKGFFVDVGAGCDPDGIGSNSLMFEQRIVDNAGHMAVTEDLHRGWPFEDSYINPKHINYRDAIAKIKSMKEKVEAR